MAPLNRLLARVPTRFTRLASRRAIPAVLAVVAVLLLGGAAAALAFTGPAGVLPGATRISQSAELPEIYSRFLTPADSDKDGIGDAFENYVYGSDPQNWNTSGTGVPDGWLVEHGYDPLLPGTRTARVASPPVEDLPAAYAGVWPDTFRMTLFDFYKKVEPAGYAPGTDDPWWLDGDQANPAQWRTPSGIPTAWLVYYGLDALDPAIGDAPADGGESPLTVREAFEFNTNPFLADSDGDGLDDIDEIETYGTDPSLFSTAGTGLPDGWAIHYGLDPADPATARADPDRDGLSNLEEYQVSRRAFESDVARDGVRYLFGRGLDPNDWQTSGSGIPDGWYVAYGLDPLNPNAADRVLQRASDFSGIKWLDEGPDDLDALPDLEMSVRDAYAYKRPPEWDENVDGVWWGGTNPAETDSDADGLPDAVEIRGWYTNVTFDLGPQAASEWLVVRANPTQADTDGDGLTDAEEYRGRAVCSEDDARTFKPTDPENKDTAFSGITDRDKVCGVVRGAFVYDFGGNGVAGLDPTRADSAGDYMRDGAKLDYWHERFTRYRTSLTYEFEDSAFDSLTDWTSKYSRFDGFPQEDVVALFRPDGDVDGDGVPNLLDADPSGGLVAESEDDLQAVFLQQGLQIDPALYRFSEFKSSFPRPVTDPANPDTDGDGLPDWWEVKYGAYVPEIGGWNLDPSKLASLGDGEPDGERNDDEDVIEWFAYEAGSDGSRTLVSGLENQPFDYSNRMEYLYGTNPNAFSTADDDVADGWKVFWGLIYPMQASSGGAGDLSTEELARVKTPLGIQPLSDLSGRGNPQKVFNYTRVVNAGETPCNGLDAYLADTGILKAGETHDAYGTGSACRISPIDTSETISVARIRGSFVLTFEREQALGTNPYLVDTDGDGAIDAYEAHYMRSVSGGMMHPDPVIPDLDDARTDRDEDKLATAHPDPNVFTESNVPGSGCDPNVPLRGTNPHLTDTDLDGIPDGIEVNSCLDPLDATDGQLFAGDTDGDGQPDAKEILGWGRTAYGETVQTRADDPDTDGDGLLDYGRRSGANGEEPIELDPSVPSEKETLDRWRARGIAWCAAPYACGPGDGRIRFLGERTGGEADAVSHPLKLDTSGDGIPDGWKEYYGQIGVYSRAPGENDPDAALLYEKGKPSWWDATRHGVWWWGASPSQADDPDVDNDGLNDLNGEDPFPSSSRNVYRHAFSEHSNVTFLSPRDAHAFIESGFDAMDVRVRAQSYGEDAGHPLNARNLAATVKRPRAATELVDVAVEGVADPASGFQVQKGRDVIVTGRLVLAEERNGQYLNGEAPGERRGVPNATVVVSAFGRLADTALGLAATNETGHFRLVANITPVRSATVPSGVVAQGQVGGTVTWNVEPDAISVGDRTRGFANTLVVWSYNSSSPAPEGSPYADYAFNTASGVVAEAVAGAQVDPFPITVTSDTRLTFNVDPVFVNGDIVRGTVRLTDAAGAALANRNVTVEWNGAGAQGRVLGQPPERIFTDDEGELNLTELEIPVGVTTPGARTLTVRFVPTAADQFLNAGAASTSVPVKNPTRLTMRVDGDASFTVGSTMTVRGTLTSLEYAVPGGDSVPERPIGSAAVRLTMGSLQSEARTDPEGRYEVTFTVPADVSAGENVLTAVFPGTGDHDAHPPVNAFVHVKRSAEVDGLRTREAQRGDTVTIQGALRDINGDGLSGRTVSISAAGRPLGVASTGGGGVFSVTVPVPASLPLGVHDYVVRFAGDDAYGPATNASRLKVFSVVTIETDAGDATAIRGQPLTVSGRLVDDRGNGVPRQAVVVAWRGQPVTSIVTDDSGRFAVPIPVSKEERLGDARVGLQYAPHATSVYRRAEAQIDYSVLSAVDLSFPDREVARGPVQLTGLLLDDRGNALSGAAVRFTWDGTYAGAARTSRNGSFVMAFEVPMDAPAGAVPVTAAFQPDSAAAVYAPTEVRATYAIVSETTIRLTDASQIVRGDEFNFTASVRQDNGAPAPGEVTVRLGDHELGAAPVENGLVQFRARIPSDVPRGPTTLSISYPGTEYLRPATLEVPSSVKVRPRVEVSLPRVAFQGLALEGEVLLKDDQDAPLRNQTFVYLAEGREQPMMGRTDSEGRAVIAGVAETGGAAFTLHVRGDEDVLPAAYTTDTVTVLGPSTPVSIAFIALLVVGTLAVAAGVLWYIRWRRRQLKEVRKIIEETIDELLAGNEYVGTIFLAYKRLSAHLATHGFVEKEEDTAREFTLGVRKAVPVKAESLRLLIQLFEEARYSDHEIGPEERDRAVQNLQAVRADLDRLLGESQQESPSEVTPA